MLTDLESMSSQNYHDRSEGATLEPTDVLGLLSNPRCRAFIYAIMDLDRDVTGLTEAIDLAEDTYREIGLNPEGITPGRFHHNVIPKLQAKEVLEYDDRTGTIRYHGDPLLEKYAEIVSEDELGKPSTGPTN